MTKVLDHGSVKYVEHWGSDERIIESARQSTGGGFRGWDQDAKLLKYLYENDHATPFEFAGLVLEVEAPLFVFREWHRHRTQSYNEASARYIALPDVQYLPSVDRLTGVDSASKNKQAQNNGKVVSKARAALLRMLWRLSYGVSSAVYKLTLKLGAPKELARVVMPVGQYSKMRCQANLRNWLSFIRLREAPNAQWEIRQFANEVHRELCRKFPRTMALYEGKHNGAS